MSIYDDDDKLSPFLAEDLHSKLKQYVQMYFNAAKHSASPNHALNERHEVNVVGVNKLQAGPLHESLTALVGDTDTKKLHAFVLERTASTRSVKPEIRFEYCTQFPDSKTVIDTIQEALQNMEQSAEPLESQPPSALQPTLISWAIHKAMSAARSSAQSFEVEADDTISGMENQALGACVRQYEPEGLTLFHLVLIALIVHEVAPIYSLFESQCYWFANIIFDVIISIYPSKTHQRPPHASPPEILLPTDYLPNQSGQFFGITINDPRVVEAVVDVVKSHFEEAKVSYQQKVILYYFRFPAG